MKTFYTYVWLREDGTPYYVGKGSGYRANTKWGRTYSPPVNKERILIQNFWDERSAFEAEKFLIAFYGRKDKGLGNLRNLTDGGEGVSGAIHSPTQRAKNSLAKRGKKHSMETRQKIRLAHAGENNFFFGKKHTPEARAKIRNARARQIFSPETRAKLSASITKVWAERRLQKAVA